MKRGCVERIDERSNSIDESSLKNFNYENKNKKAAGSRLQQNVDVGINVFYSVMLSKSDIVNMSLSPRPDKFTTIV